MIEIPQVIRDYIDGLDDAGRDRIIAGELLLGGVDVDGTGPDGVGCLMQLGEGVRYGYSFHKGISVGFAFDDFVRAEKGGESAERIAALKAYAARGNNVDAILALTTDTPTNANEPTSP